MTTIALTISPKDRLREHMHYKNPYQSIYMDDTHLFIYVFRKARLTDYKIYPELDLTGRLHYHGTLVLDDNQVTRFYRYVKPRLSQLGFIHSKKLLTKEDLERWEKYCIKEWDCTKLVVDVTCPFTDLVCKTHVKQVKEFMIKPSTILDYLVPVEEDN